MRSDPGTHFAASVEGWDYPLTREGWMLADLIDVQGQSKAGKKWTPYPRPIAAKADKKRRGNAAGRSGAEVIEILRGFGHGSPV